MTSPTSEPTEAELFLGRIGMKGKANGVPMTIEPFETSDIGPGFILVYEGKVLGFAVDTPDAEDPIYYLDRSNDGHTYPGEPTIDYIQEVRDAR